MPLEPVFVELLGGLRISSAGGKAVEIAPRLGGGVLAHLALHLRRKHSREELIDLFWPEDEVEEGRNRLRKALHYIRGWIQEAGADPDAILQADRREVLLNAQCVSTDALQFEAFLAAAARTADCTERAVLLRRAVELYRGELLPGFYEECFLAERTRLALAFETALHDLIRAHESLGETEQALEAALHVVALNPASEDARCAVMRLFAARGQPDSVLRQYRELERALEAEVGEKPCEDTRRLMESLVQTGCETRTAQRVRTSAVQVTVPEARPSESFELPEPAQSEKPPIPAPRRLRRLLFAGALAAIAFCSAIIIGVSVVRSRAAAHDQQAPSTDLRKLPLSQLSAIAWRESYGPDEEKIGEVVLARWPEIRQEAARLHSRPAELAAFAAPLWRMSFVLGKDQELSGWLKQALDSGAPMKPADEALAAAGVTFTAAIPDATGEFDIKPSSPMPYARRAQVAAHRTGDPWLIAHCLRALGFVEASGGRESTYDLYRSRYAEAYRIYQQLRDLRGMALVETSYASGYGVDGTFQGRCRERVHWALKAWWHWQEIGNSWGIGFSARLLQQVLAWWDHPNEDSDAAISAITVFETMKQRMLSRGALESAGKFTASQALLLVQRDSNEEASRLLREVLGSEMGSRRLDLGECLDRFERSRYSDPSRRELIKLLRSIILD